VGRTIRYDETVYLISMLMRDPTSWTQASVSKWSHPVSYEWTVLASTYDLLAQVNSKRKPKPYPRPWPKGNQTRKGTTRTDARELLAKAKQGDYKWQNKPTPT
jgi:hypothetical protein